MTEPDFLRDTRASYDAVANVYADRFREELAAKPLDRATLARFAEMMVASGAGPVADIGCGPVHKSVYEAWKVAPGWALPGSASGWALPGSASGWALPGSA